MYGNICGGGSAGGADVVLCKEIVVCARPKTVSLGGVVEKFAEVCIV